MQIFRLAYRWYIHGVTSPQIGKKKQQTLSKSPHLQLSQYFTRLMSWFGSSHEGTSHELARPAQHNVDNLAERSFLSPFASRPVVTACDYTPTPNCNGMECGLASQLGLDLDLVVVTSTPPQQVQVQVHEQNQRSDED